MRIFVNVCIDNDGIGIVKYRVFASKVERKDSWAREKAFQFYLPSFNLDEARIIG